MKTYIIFIGFILLLLHACTLKTKKGKIIFKYELRNNQQEVIIVHKNSMTRDQRDTLIIRFLSGFSNESAKVCVNDQCNQYDSLTTNLSIAFASSIMVQPIRNAEQMDIKLRGLIYSIPIKREFSFIDLDINKQNVLKVTYSNNILLLSLSRKNSKFRPSGFFPFLQNQKRSHRGFGQSQPRWLGKFKQVTSVFI